MLYNKRTQTDAENHTTTWTYDERGRPISRTLPDGIRNEIMVYDFVGNLAGH
ncbi:MAG: RHS repeat domain-containing protein [Pseudomonadota bacterium]